MRKDDNDYIGSKFGRLLAIKDLGRRIDAEGYPRRWLEFRCDCKNVVEKSLKDVKRGSAQSCGCLYIETHIKHGLTKHPLYLVHYSMIDRCYNEDHEAYNNYGKRGIKVCKSWLEEKNYTGLKTFFAWAMNNGYRKGLDIDRTNNDKGYSPNNCRFVTRVDNCNNTRNTLRFNYEGINYTLTSLLKKHGHKKVKSALVRDRLRAGWSIEKAIKTVPR